MKRKHSIKRATTSYIKKLDKLALKIIEPQLRTLYKKIKRKHLSGEKQKSKFLRMASNLYDIQLDKIKNDDNVIERLRQIEKARQVNIKEYSNRDLKWYSKLFEIKLYNGEVLDKRSNFLTKILQGLEDRGIDITNIDLVKEQLGGLSPEQLEEFAEFAVKKEKAEKFFYDIWFNEDYSNDDLIKLIIEFAEKHNRVNATTKKLEKLMN